MHYKPFRQSSMLFRHNSLWTKPHQHTEKDETFRNPSVHDFQVFRKFFGYSSSYTSIRLILLQSPLSRTLSEACIRWINPCLLYTSDAADDLLCVDLGGR